MNIYPFTAIVGQEAMKTALILHAVDPSIGGILIRGQKGTAKSTAVRAFADLLPPVKAVKTVHTDVILMHLHLYTRNAAGRWKAVKN